MGTFFVFLLIMILMIAVCTGAYSLIRIVNDRSAARREIIRATRLQNDHRSSLQSIDLAKAWELAYEPDKAPALPKGPERITPDVVIGGKDHIDRVLKRDRDRYAEADWP